jgi:hypothetical protein
MLASLTMNCTVAVFTRILIRLKRGRGMSVLVLLYATLTPGAYSQLRSGFISQNHLAYVDKGVA